MSVPALTLFVCFTSLVLKRLQKTWIWLENVGIAAVPAERYRSNAVCESFILVLQHCQLLEQTSSVDHALLIVRNGDTCDESHFYEDLLFGY